MFHFIWPIDIKSPSDKFWLKCFFFENSIFFKYKYAKEINIDFFFSQYDKEIFLHILVISLKSTLKIGGLKI